MGGWTTEEDHEIIKHVNNVGYCKWSVLASKLPGRLAKQCRNRHQKLQRKEEETECETPFEKQTEKTARDQKFVYHVKDTEETDKNVHWLMVKTNTEASNKSHYKKKGNWSLEEDQKILNHVKATKETGEDVDWFLLASSLLGRNENQCEHRYNKLMFMNKKKKLKKGGWTAEEDHEIIEHVNKFGDSKWRIVASRLPGRYPNQCMRGLKKLHRMNTK